MATIGIKTIQAIRRDLNALIVTNSSNAAKFNPRLNHRNAGDLESRLGLLPQTTAAHVDIVAGAAHQGVTYPTAHEPGLKTGCLKRT